MLQPRGGLLASKIRPGSGIARTLMAFEFFSKFESAAIAAGSLATALSIAVPSVGAFVSEAVTSAFGISPATAQTRLTLSRLSPRREQQALTWAADFMSKPFSFEELMATLKRRIRSPNEAQDESILVHGNVALDLRTRRVTASGIEHDLTARESTMLEFFLCRPRQVISREQLLSRVWGLGHDPASNVVDVYIRYQRQRLGKDFRSG